VSQLTARMRETYHQTTGGRDEVAKDYLRACASAAKAVEVQDALGLYNLADPCRFTVAHPDTGDEYYQPE
jgi:hypothetical protein